MGFINQLNYIYRKWVAPTHAKYFELIILKKNMDCLLFRHEESHKPVMCKLFNFVQMSNAEGYYALL